MKRIPDCLAAFSVAAMTNTPQAEALAGEAIAAHLAGVGGAPRRRLAALHELYAAYVALALDSGAALAIKADIENRIVEAAASPVPVVISEKHP